MSSTLFSPLSKGYGSWEDGDLEAQDQTALPKPILPNLLEGEDESFKDKTLNIPLRTKNVQSAVTELLKTKITAPPPEETYTVYSRPKTAATSKSTFSHYSPRTTAQSVRAKSAATSLSARNDQTIRPDGELVLPKTFLTRRGALLLFSSPDELMFSKEQKCYLSGQLDRPVNLFEDGPPLRTVNKLTSSVLQYGRDWGPGTDVESYSSQYDKTFLKFLKNVDDETAMDLHAQPGGDMSFYIRDLQGRTRSTMGFRPTSGRSVTSELERAELTEELRKMDEIESGRSHHLISADVSQLMEPYSLQLSRPSSIGGEMKSSRPAVPSKSRLSASRLAASLKSTNYLGRHLVTPQPMTISPWGRTETPSDIVDLPMTVPSPGSRPATEEERSRPVSVKSRSSFVSGQRSEGESGSAILRQEEEEDDDEILAALRDDFESSVHTLGRAQPIIGGDTDALGKDGQPITDRYSRGEESLVDETQNVVDIGGTESGTESIWRTPGMPEEGQELGKGDVEQEQLESRPASAPPSITSEEDQWIGTQLDDQRPKSVMSLSDLEKIHTTPVSEKDRRASSQVESEKVVSAAGSKVGSRRGSREMWSVTSSRPGSVKSDSRPGSVKAESRPGSVRDSRPGTAKEESRPVSVKAESRPDSVKDGSRRSSVKPRSRIDSERARSGVDSRPTSAMNEIDQQELEETRSITQPLEATYKDIPSQPDLDEHIAAELSLQDDTTIPPTPPPTSTMPTPSISAGLDDEITPGSAIEGGSSLIGEELTEDQTVQSGVTKTSQQSTPTHKQGVPKDVLIIPKSPTPPAPPPTQIDKTPSQKTDEPATEKSTKTPSKKTTKHVTKHPVPTPRSPVKIPSSTKTTSPKKEEKIMKEEVEKPAPLEKKESALDLGALRAMVTKKDDSKDKSKAKKAGIPKKEKRRKASKMQYVDSIGIEGYDEPSKEEIERMVQEELAKEMAEKNIAVISPKPSDKPSPDKVVSKPGRAVSVVSKDDSGIDTMPPTDTESSLKSVPPSEVVPIEPVEDKPPVEVTSEDEDAAIEAQLKAKFADKPKNKKTKKQIAKEKAALKETRLQEKLKREEELRELEEKKKQKEEEKRRQEMLRQRNKQIAEEEAEDAAREAEEARQAEEEARQMLQVARKKAREERDAKRKAETERRKQEREAQREERKRMEEEAKKREQEMLERLASAEERKKMREDAEERQWQLEEEMREEEEERMRQEEDERKRMLAEEEKIRDLEREAEEEAMARLIRERLEAEEKKRLAEETREKERQEEEKRRQEKLRRQEAEAERARLRELEEQRRMEEERQRLLEIQRMEDAARERVRLDLEKRREILLRRRDQNREHMHHLTNVRNTQGMTRPWVFSYYVHWPRATYEKPLPSSDKKKKGFRARPKPPPPKAP